MTRFPWKPGVILARSVDFHVPPTNALPWQPDVRFSRKFFFCWKILRKSILAIICLNFTFSTIFLVNDSHRAIKVHANNIQYCRAGILYCTFSDQLSGRGWRGWRSWRSWRSWWTLTCHCSCPPRLAMNTDYARIRPFFRSLFGRSQCSWQ